MPTFEIIVYLICLLGEAFFAGIETGMIAINRLRLRHMVEEDEDPQARILEGFLVQPNRLLGTTLVGVNVCMVAASILGTRMGHRLPWRGGEVLAEAVTITIVLIFCEYLPKAWFQSQPLRHCRPFAGLLRLTEQALRPLAAVLTRASMLIVSGERHPPGRPSVTRDEIGLLARESAEHGVLTPKQRIMIHRVVEMAGKTVRQVMVPREKIISVTDDQTAGEFLQAARGHNLTRLPVRDRQQDVFIGIVNLFDVLAAPPARHNEKITVFMRPPQFLPDATPLTEVLPRLRHASQPLALATDARDTVIGLLTTEDIVRHITGAS